MITEQERKRRRVKYRLVQLVLVVLSVGIVMAFFVGKRTGIERRDRDGGRNADFSLSANPPATPLLGAGDAQIFSIDTTLNLILAGDRVYAGLAPQKVEEIREEIRREVAKETKQGNDFGAMIAKTVTDQVADKIDMHVSWDVRDIQDIRFENGRIVVDWRGGGNADLFGKVNRRDGDGESNRFRREDAQRFIELVKARQKSL